MNSKKMYSYLQEEFRNIEIYSDPLLHFEKYTLYFEKSPYIVSSILYGLYAFFGYIYTILNIKKLFFLTFLSELIIYNAFHFSSQIDPYLKLKGNIGRFPILPGDTNPMNNLIINPLYTLVSFLEGFLIILAFMVCIVFFIFCFIKLIRILIYIKNKIFNKSKIQDTKYLFETFVCLLYSIFYFVLLDFLYVDILHTWVIISTSKLSCFLYLKYKITYSIYQPIMVQLYYFIVGW